ncbi:MAG: substrate-binding domain-containing protein, partial [Hyphomicrobiales bacterium]
EAGAPVAVRILAFTDEVFGRDITQSPFFFQLVRDIEREARKAGYDCLFTVTPLEEADQKLQRLATTSNNPGMLVLGANLTDEMLDRIAASCPKLVVIDNSAADTPHDSVVMNNRMGAKHAAFHLLKLGHRRIGYGYGEVRIPNFREREEGFHSALGEHGIELASADRLALPSDILGANSEFKNWLERRRTPLPTAFFCENDYMAIGALRALSQAGYHLPQDVSVIGFDDIAESAVTTPDLTTVHVSTDIIARAAISRLLSRASEEFPVPIKQIVDTRLIVRGSTTVPLV